MYFARKEEEYSQRRGSAAFHAVMQPVMQDACLQLFDILPYELPLLFQKSHKGSFVTAQFFAAIATGKGGICLLVKPFGMDAAEDLPYQQEKHCHCEKTPGIKIIYKDKRRKHHGIVPVVYAAASAALVFHHPFLERTEEQDTYHIAHRVGKAYEYEDTFIDDICKEKGVNGSVEQQPASKHDQYRMFWLTGVHVPADRLAGRDKVA